MLVPYDFHTLSLNQAMERVNQEGTFVASDPRVPSNFYTLGDFYVEVVLDSQTTKVVQVRAFSTGEHYDRMLAFMDLKACSMWIRG